MTHHPIWQYQGAAGPASTQVPAHPFIEHVHMALLALPILGEFVAPLTEPTVEVTAIPQASEHFERVPAAPVEGHFDRPIEHSDDFASWMSDATLLVPIVAPQLGEFSLALDEHQDDLPWIDVRAPLPWVMPEQLGDFVSPQVDDRAFPQVSEPDQVARQPDQLGAFELPLVDVREHPATDQSDQQIPVPEQIGQFEIPLLDVREHPEASSPELSPPVPDILGVFELPIPDTALVTAPAIPDGCAVDPTAPMPEQLGWYDGPLLDLRWQPQASEPDAPLRQPEQLGGLASPLLESLPDTIPTIDEIEPHLPVAPIFDEFVRPLEDDRTRPQASDHPVWPRTPEHLGWYDSPLEVPAPPVDANPLPGQDYLLPPLPEQLGWLASPPLEIIVQAPPGLFESNGNIIRSRWQTLIAGPLALPTQYDNAPFNKPDFQPWCALEVELGGLIHRTFGDQNTFRKRGEFFAKLHVPAEDGTGTLTEILDEISAQFRLKVDGVVTFGVPRVVSRTRVGAWMEMVVACTFHDDIRVALPTGVAGSITGQDDIEMVVRTRFADLVATPEALPFARENAPFTTPDSTPWAELTVLSGETVPAELGAIKTYRTHGVVMVRINIPLESGDAEARRLADVVVRNFRTVRDRGVLFRTPRAGKARAVGPWWTVNIEIPFLADLRAV